MRFRSRLLIHFDRLERNVGKIKSRAKTADILFMVKARAYGHGMREISHFSHFDLGIKNFGCATLQEALELRQNILGEFEIYVFSDVQLELRESADLYLNQRLIPVISNQQDLSFVLENKEFKHFPLTLKFNTGMNRLGLNMDRVEDIVSMIKKSGRRSIFHLMTHFSSASQSMNSNKRNLEQIQSFNKLKEEFRSRGIEIERSSLSNSGAIEQGVGLSETHIRPGLITYGPSSLLPHVTTERPWDGEIISDLETHVIHVFETKKGTPIGYGGSPCPADGVVIILAIGYGDGFSTAYQGAHLNWQGHRGQIVGRVNMDMIQVLFPMELKDHFQVGMPFTIWDHDRHHFETLSRETKLLSYEMTCQLTSRIPRVFSPGI